MPRFKFIPQFDRMDCGPACLSMVASYHGKKYSLQYLRENSFITREGVSLLGINEAAKKIGFDTYTLKLRFEELLIQKNNFPVIIYWNQNHFVVLLDVKQSLISKKKKFKLADPAHGIIYVSEENFRQSWLGENSEGICLFLNPGENFNEMQAPASESYHWTAIRKHLQPHRKRLLIISGMLFLGSCISLVFPYLTKQLIDSGINQKNLNIIILILLGQLALFFGTLLVEVVRNWLTLVVGSRLSISFISDFLKKILMLPISFFETKVAGDFNQRIQDNERIEAFLTSSALTTFFSFITFIVFFGVLWYYNALILITYFVLTGSSLLWSGYWLGKRKILDYHRFRQRVLNQESIYEIINGVAEMKLNQFESYKQNQWKKIQEKLFKINIKILKLDVIQNSGFDFLNQIKNILVTFLAALFVVRGTMTLGELLSVSFIVGQMNSPVNQLISFLRSYQDAKLSLDRLNEVQRQPVEDDQEHVNLNNIACGHGIDFRNTGFQYEGPNSVYVLRNINLLIPEGKITAIVGASGSGKSTLMKLLLKFYKASEGLITYDHIDINTISASSIRQNSGTVMQDGYIFSDTIARNIGLEENIDIEKLRAAAKVANIDGFIESLPMGYNSQIGSSGNGLSGGQKQRILIARAVYKNPKYIFFDEATSALDAENERIIHSNLERFFKGRTVVIIAHRLSTVKNADQIVVLKEGVIVEIGTHSELVSSRGDYFNLVKNQLELGD